MYGYTAVETPNLDRLRDDSILFERAYSHVPLTLPSHASMLSGQLPPEHGVRDNLGYRLDATDGPWLPARLRDLGYRTGAAISAYVLRSSTGIGSGFDHYEDDIALAAQAALGRLQRSGAETFEASLDWLASVRSGPFFYFFHTYEPHSPYTPPEPFRSRYPDRPYDGEVAEADRQVGLLLQKLEEWDLYDSAVIVLTSDHGEGLGEHEQQEHEVLVYRENLQVPLLIKLPDSKRGGDAVAAPVQLVDLYPTLLEVVGETPEPGLQGSSLLAASPAADRPIYAESLYPRLHYGWSDLASVIQGKWHFIAAPRPELYDLDRDPGELDNVAAANRSDFARLRKRLDEFGFSFARPTDAGDEDRAKLAALGYVGSVAAEDGAPLADPKDRMHVVASLGRAFGYFFQSQYGRAEQAFAATVAEEPQLIDAWEHLGKARHRLGRFDQAEQAFRRALELSGGAPHIALAAAEMFLEAQDLDQARAHAELARGQHEVALDILAQIAVRQERLDDAEALIQGALPERGRRLGPLITQVDLRIRQGRLQEAVALSQAVEEEASGGDPVLLRGLFFLRGTALARLGEAGPAAAAFEREIALSPNELASYTHLAYLYALTGNPNGAGETLRRMVDTNPTPHAFAEAVRTLRAMNDTRSAAGLLRQARSRWPRDPELAELALR